MLYLAVKSLVPKDFIVHWYYIVDTTNMHQLNNGNVYSGICLFWSPLALLTGGCIRPVTCTQMTQLGINTQFRQVTLLDKFHCIVL